MTLPVRTVADDPVEHVSDHNTLHDFFNVGGSGLYETIDFDREYGPGKSASIDDQALVQQALNETPDGTVLKFSAGSYWVGSPLIVKNGSRLKGPTTFRAKTGFDFSATVTPNGGHFDGEGVGVVMSSNGGVGQLGRIYLDDVTISGNNIANSRGLMGAMQQPAEWKKVRVEGCLDFGVKLVGQQLYMPNFMAYQNRIGVIFDNFQFLDAPAFNIEQSSEIGMQSVSSNNANLVFSAAHFENNPIDVDYLAGDSMVFTSPRHSNEDGDVAYRLAGDNGLVITQGRNAIATNTGVAIDHPDYGELRWWDAFRGHLNWIQEGPPSSFVYLDPWRWTWTAGGGKLIRFGGRYAANMALRPASTNLKDLMNFENNAGVIQSRVTRTGEFEYLVNTLGPILLDRSNATKYRLKVTAGVLGVEVVP